MKNNFYQSLRSFLLLAIVMLGSFSSFAQDRKVSGKVSGTDSQGIPGVSILVKGTNTGATTDVNGAFSVTVKSDAAVLNIRLKYLDWYVKKRNINAKYYDKRLIELKKFIIDTLILGVR